MVKNYTSLKSYGRFGSSVLWDTLYIHTDFIFWQKIRDFFWQKLDPKLSFKNWGEFHLIEDKKSYIKIRIWLHKLLKASTCFHWVHMDFISGQNIRV